MHSTNGLLREAADFPPLGLQCLTWGEHDNGQVWFRHAAAGHLRAFESQTCGHGGVGATREGLS